MTKNAVKGVLLFLTTSFSTVRKSMDITEIGRKSPAPVTGDVLGTGVVSSFPNKWKCTLGQQKID